MQNRIVHRKVPVSGLFPPKSMIIFLHGYGANGADLFSLSNILSSAFPDTQFIAPDAPTNCAMSQFGKEWFPLEEIPFGAYSASQKFLKFLESESTKYSIPMEKIILFGFSQGAMMSLQTALLSKIQLGAILSYSGALDKKNILLSQNNIIKGKHKFSNTPIMLVHGESDEVVPHSSQLITKNLLSEIGFKVEILSIPKLAHGIDEECINAGIKFINKYIFNKII